MEGEVWVLKEVWMDIWDIPIFQSREQEVGNPSLPARTAREYRCTGRRTHPNWFLH